MPRCNGTVAADGHLGEVLETPSRSRFSVEDRPIPVIVNRRGGTAARLGDGLEAALRDAFAAAGVAVRIELTQPELVSEMISRCDDPLIVVGGGDGTLGAAAGKLAGTGRRMAILPLGTRNHLARDLGIPGDLEGAARVVATGRAEAIDLGRAADRIFVNNCSIGLYASLVHERDKHDLPKWLASIPAAWRVLRSSGAETFRIEHHGAEHRVESPLLFVGNNRFSLDAGRLGRRASLSDGVLAMAAVAPVSRAELLGMALRLIAGKADAERDFAAIEDVEVLTVYGYHRRRVALDGELVRLQFPLKISILPAALQVLVPASPPA
ncbi:hypothetical protein H7F51_13270 [Novosphingobium flavum]|uniref:DAGKc domain-containing protein n=1 Tax=Novosphingobium flavum TaxID=1778672 RepID=A0A7X1KMC9_9SPHN|nr:diacylglycerol kinase family protein [Novosphingobium flavum]MBC2666492.1 hypothetical protein [Novosphingobium flavum]